MKKLQLYLCGFVTIVLSLAIIVANTYAQSQYGGSTNAGAGGSSTNGTSACQDDFDEYGGCLSVSSNGAFWVKIPADSDHMPFNRLKNRYFTYLYPDVRNTEIFNCLTGGRAAYVLVTRMYLSGHRIGGLGAGVPLSTALSHPIDGDGNPIPDGVEVIPWVDAEANFRKYETIYAERFNQYWRSDSGLTWFCADFPGEVPQPEVPNDIDKVACGAYLSREKADTKTRIAVQNMTIDGSQPPVDVNGNAVEWAARANRRSSSFKQDTMWTDGGGDVGTLAKPGDTVRFYHAFCMAVRYARQTNNGGGGYQSGTRSHDTVYGSLPAQSASIGASPSNYLFGNLGLLANVNSQLSGVRAFENLFTDSGEGVSVDSRRYAISILQPTGPSQDYNCREALANYMMHGEGYIAGGYQVPGFDVGNCTAASKTGIKNPVGTTISQYHTFDSLKMWEMYSHTNNGESCGCGTDNRHGHTDYTANSFEAAWQGGRLGYHRENYCRTNGTCCRSDWSDCCLTRLANGECCREWFYDIDQSTGIIKDSYCKTDGVWRDNATSYTETPNTNLYAYKSMHALYGTPTKRATVYIPYNFNTELNTSIATATDVVFQGTPVGTSHYWQIVPRENSILSSFPYATVTPSDTKVRLIEYLMKPGSYDVGGTASATLEPCEYFRSKGGEQCTTIEEYNGNQNPEGYYSGSREYVSNHVRTIPDNDEYVGYKYCIAVGIWPADSHDGSGNNLSQQYSRGLHGAMDAGQFWKISGASCRTIAKKPNFQVWNGSVYTEGKIQTSITKKWLNSPMGREYDGSSTNIFGSWSDYGIYAYDSNTLMASGATLGYNNSRYDLSGDGGQRMTTTAQKLSPQTASNTSEPTGYSGIYTNASYGTNLLRLTARYKDKAQTFAQSEMRTGSQAKIFTSKTGMHYVYYNGTLHTKNLSVDYNTNPNSNTVAKNGNNITVGLGNGRDDNTLVIYATGNVVIDGDICLGGCSGNATKLSSYATGTNTDAAAKLPQVLIFANNISIAENVTRVDAWLITPNGTLNTCAEHNMNNVVARDAKQRAEYVNRFGGNCDRTLVINGPVYAHHIDLLRTAGAAHGSSNSTVLADPRERTLGANRSADDANLGSAAPAEIFNLRADAYIWAYNQAQRYSEAVVTYMRELAPRY